MRVVVTRAPGQAEPLASRIAELGHEVVLCPLIRIDRIGGGPVELSAYDWVIVTSPNGAEELMARARGRPRGSRLSGRGRRRRSRGPASWRISCRRCRPRKACLPSCRDRRAACSSPPRRAPARSSSTSSARTSCRSTGRPSCAPLPPAGDVVVLASASAARAFGALGAGIPAVSIGPQTTAAAREAGIRVISEAQRHDLDGLVDAIARLDY